MLQRFFLWLWGKYLAPPSKKDDTTAVPSVPDTTTQVVYPAIKGTSPRYYMSPNMVLLLAFIRIGESGKAGYDADYRNNDHFGDLSQFTFDTVRDMGRRQVSVKQEASSAIGGYQFLTKTLDSLKSTLNLTGTEKFTHELQDDLAVALMIRRGLMKYRAVSMNLISFGNSLAQEWASLPVLSSINGAHRAVKRGMSYYAGDGLNAALHSADTVEMYLAAIRSEVW